MMRPTVGLLLGLSSHLASSCNWQEPTSLDLPQRQRLLTTSISPSVAARISAGLATPICAVSSATRAQRSGQPSEPAVSWLFAAASTMALKSDPGKSQRTRRRKNRHLLRTSHRESGKHRASGWQLGLPRCTSPLQLSSRLSEESDRPAPRRHQPRRLQPAEPIESAPFRPAVVVGAIEIANVASIGGELGLRRDHCGHLEPHGARSKARPLQS